jgi:xylulokinase
MNLHFLSIDAGTTSLKAAIFNETGDLLAVSRQEYGSALATPQPAWVEMQPEMYWQACCRSVRQVVQESQVPASKILSLCISSQGETLVMLDDQDQPVRPAIVWLDNRAAQEAQEIAARFDVETVYTVTGQPEVTPTWPACKLLWLRRHEPEVFARTRRFLLLEDYLLYRLAGQFVTESALQTSSLLYDINRHTWWEEMLEFLELDPARLGSLRHPGEIVGSLTPQAAAELGLSPQTRAVCGGMDQVLGALGAGNLHPGVVSESTGGALGIVASLERPQLDPLRRVPCHCHAAGRPAGGRLYCLLPWGQTAGMALKWFRDQFYPLEFEHALRSGQEIYDLMTAEAAAVPPGCDGLVALPHLEGATCPEFNPNARGVFFGATLRHTRAHFVRSLLEAVAFMLRRNLELVEDLGVPIHEVRSTGGGARSPLWLQIKADVLQKPVVSLATEETALLGAAMLGAVALGVYPDLDAAAAQMVHPGQRYDPDPSLRPVYDLAYARYLELYQHLEPMFN